MGARIRKGLGGIMIKVAFKFNRVKAIEVILYLAKNVSDHDIYGICKLLYLADKTSLEKYGRFVFGESYVAMEQGATPSNAYDLLKKATERPSSGIEVKGFQIIPLREPNLDYLSKSDIECLDQIIDMYGKVPNWRRADDAHDNAWKKSWDKRGNKKSVEIPIESIAEVLANSDELIDHLSNVG
jgi:uncharacterized phage-associated protein